MDPAHDRARRPSRRPSGVPTGTTGVDWQATVVSASLADVTQTPTGGLLAVGADPRGGVLWASNDGIDWTVVDDGPAFDRVRLTGIAAGDKLTIAIGCDLRDGKCTTPGVWVDRGNGWRRAATGSTFAHATLTDVAIDGDHAESSWVACVAPQPCGEALMARPGRVCRTCLPRTGSS